MTNRDIRYQRTDGQALIKNQPFLWSFEIPLNFNTFHFFLKISISATDWGEKTQRNKQPFSRIAPF